MRQVRPPREGSHFDKGGLGLAKALALRLFSSANKAAPQRKYRKLVSGLNTALNTTEVLMAARLRVDTQRSSSAGWRAFACSAAGRRISTRL